MAETPLNHDGSAQWHLHDTCMPPILIRVIQPKTCLPGFEPAWIRCTDKKLG
ncbi:hypothetical protein [Cryptosporangium phraense]|uniref:hypothetical protein n=1 Tax=Cryptosporangium phraense TaxID=2593070 RepID=UPI00147979A2|nr:hypothetical protein [Cryptosporangium phraense]